MKKTFSRQDYSKQTEQFSYKADIASMLAKNIGSGFSEIPRRAGKCGKV